MSIKSGIGICLIVALSGCQLDGIKSKTKFGPEFRHNGTKNTNRERWSIQEGIELKWENGVTTAVSYRRRDDNDGGGNNDNGVWLEVGVPIWENPKRKSKLLEQRIQHLEDILRASENRKDLEISDEVRIK